MIKHGIIEHTPELDKQIKDHDWSKFEKAEFFFYAQKFYGSPQELNRAGFHAAEQRHYVTHKHQEPRKPISPEMQHN
jgi:hypothetical protein